MEKIKKHPIGIRPKYIFDLYTEAFIKDSGGISEAWVLQNKKNRLEDLKSTILRYFDTNTHIDLKWLVEYNSLLTELGINENKFKL